MDELLQGVFATLWANDGRRLRAWNRTVASFNTYIGAIAGNYAKDRFLTRWEQLLVGTDDLPEIAIHADGPYELVEFDELLGVATIAEHVETVGVADRLRELDVTLAQGFHFARPQSFAEIVRQAALPSPAAAEAKTRA